MITFLYAVEGIFIRPRNIIMKVTVHFCQHWNTTEIVFDTLPSCLAEKEREKNYQVFWSQIKFSMQRSSFFHLHLYISYLNCHSHERVCTLLLVRYATLYIPSMEHQWFYSENSLKTLFNHCFWTWLASPHIERHVSIMPMVITP